jgi:hypothetical protein
MNMKALSSFEKLRVTYLIIQHQTPEDPYHEIPIILPPAFSKYVHHIYMHLTLNLLMTTIVAPPSNASKWQMGFNLVFKGLISFFTNNFTSS